MDTTGSPYVIDWAGAAARLATAAGLDASWYAAVAARLVEPADRLAVDVGCGGAGMAFALAGAMTAGRVLAVDGDPAVLAAARERAAGADTGEVAVSFAHGDLDAGLADVLPADRRAADVVWASGAVHHAGDQRRAVAALAALLAPGGRLALAEGGLPLRCLPWDVGVGEPGLESRLDAAQERWFGRMRGELPDSVPMPYGWTRALRDAGLVDVCTVSWLLEAPTPLSAADRDRVVAELGHRVDRLRQTGLLAAADLAAWDGLLDPEADEWLGHRDDLQRLTARSVHIGRRPAG